MLRRLIFIAALAAGISYWFADAVTIAGPLHLAWKGAGVGLLAGWAATRARSVDGWVLAGAMVVYAIADVALEVWGMVAGAAVFILAHLGMILLYLRNRRPLRSRDRMIAGLIVMAVPLAAFLLPQTRAEAVQVASYAAVLGAMAAAAMVSTFRPDRVLLGAMLFVASDLLIFAQLGPLAHSAIPGIAIWPLYFGGQVLVATGVVAGLEAKQP